jgi:hypothetical protein
MRYQDVKQDYVGVRGELGDLRSATANLILVVDTLLSRMQTHRDKEGYGYDSHNGSGISRGTRCHCRSQEAFAVKELLSKGIRLLVALGVTLWVILNSPVAWAGPGGNIPGPGVCDYPGVGGSNFEAGATSYYCDFPIEENSTHWHCEYGGWNLGGPGGNAPIGGAFMGFGLTIPAGDFGGATGGCSWRWPDNTIGPAPNPPGAWKNYLVPKPPPPEHRAPPTTPAEPESGPPPVVNPNLGDEPQTPAYTNPAFPNPGRTENPPS